MARLMRYMINYQGRKLFSTLSIKLSKPVVYSFPPPLLKQSFEDGVCWECRLSVANMTAFNKGTVFRYTVDGSVPDESSPAFIDGVLIDRNCTVRIIAIYEDKNTIIKSADAGTLTISTLRNAVPWFQLEGLTVKKLDTPVIVREDGELPSECIIGCTNIYPEGVKVHYTVDGSEPVPSSPVLPAVIDHNCKVKVKAISADNSSNTTAVDIDDLRNAVPAFLISEI